MIDYAWLRLPPPDERGKRGRLFPVDLAASLQELVEECGGTPEQVAELGEAIRALRRAQAALTGSAMPAGCEPIAGASFRAAYPADVPVDLPSDGTYRRVTLATRSGVGVLRYRVVPRSDPRAFRLFELDNPHAAPLLTGPLEVYLDGEYVVTSRLPATPESGRLRLALGVEERIRVARNATYHESESGLFTTSSTLAHRVVVELRSQLEADAELEVFERLPIAEQGSEIEVTLGEVRPKPQRDRGTRGEELPGCLRWDLQLGRRSEQTVSFAYTIGINARKELVGGNRREP